MGDEGADGVLERIERGDESVEFSPSGMDKGLEGDIVAVVQFARRESNNLKEGRRSGTCACLLTLIAHDYNQKSKAVCVE